MKVKISKKLLSEAVSTAAKFSASKTTLAVLQTILLATEFNQLKISATNLEQGLVVTVPVDMTQPGACCVDAKDFSDWVGAVDGDIELELKDSKLTAKATGNTTKFVVVNASEFPPLPIVEGEAALTLPAGQWKKIVSMAGFASTDDARPILQGLGISLNGQMKVSATDGFRLATLVINDTKCPEASAVIPAKAVKLLDSVLPKTLDSPVGFTIKHDKAIWIVEKSTVFSNTVDGKFPPVEQIIPRSVKVAIELNNPALTKAIKPVAVVARDTNNVLRVDLLAGAEGQPTHMHLSANSSETGSAESDCDTTSVTPSGYSWSPTYFNLLFLQEVLKIFPPKVVLNWNAANTPLKVTSKEDPGLTAVLMPVNPGLANNENQEAGKQNAAAVKAASEPPSP